MRRPFLVCLALVSAAACNAITGEHDRFLASNVEDEADTGTEPDRDTGGPTPPGDSGPKPDRVDTFDADAGPTTQEVVVGTNWGSPNNAQTTTTGNETKLASCPPPNHHCMVTPFPAPTTKANYKVRARIRAGAQHEYGIFVRGRGTGNTFTAIVLSSRFSSGATLNTPFLAPIAAATDNPGTGDPGQAYPFVVDKVWIFEVEANEAEVRGKISREDNPAVVLSSMTFVDPAPANDRGFQIGFYGYQPPGGAPPPNATLLELKITF